MPAARAARFQCCIVALPTLPNYMPILKKKGRVKYVHGYFCLFKLVQFPSFSFKLVSSSFYSRRLSTINQSKKNSFFFSTDPKFTCLNKGLFLCINCCGVHTSFNNESESARIKSIEIGDWTEAMLGVSKQHIQQYNYNYFHLYFAEYKKCRKMRTHCVDSVVLFRCRHCCETVVVKENITASFIRAHATCPPSLACANAFYLLSRLSLKLETNCSLAAYQRISANRIGSGVSSFVSLTEQRCLSTTSYCP